MAKILFKTILARFLIILAWFAFFVSLLLVPHFLKQNHSKNTLYIFTWPGILDPIYIKKFEDQYNVRVKISYYESNEELLIKLKATQARDYDLIVPSDYAVNILRKEKILQKIDRSQLNFFKRLNPLLLNHYYDKNNEYSIPFDWGIYGLGIDTTYFDKRLPEASWSLVFDPKRITGQLAMVNDTRDAISLVKLYLFNNISHLDTAQKEQIKSVLKAQRPFVLAYTDARADYLLATHNCPLVVSASSYMWRGMRQYPYIKFIVPQEGTLLTIENFAIPVTSHKTELVYKFLNFIYSPSSIKHHFDTNALLPATLDAQSWHDVPEDMKLFLLPTVEQFKKFHFFEPVMTEQEFHETWVAIKS